MQVLGYRAATSFSAHPDIKSWANTTAINPGRVPTHMENMPEFLAASRASSPRTSRRESPQWPTSPD